QAAHQRNGWDDIGPMPAAVQTALNPDSLQASNGGHYQRDAQGRWHHQGDVAQGNVALEDENPRDAQRDKEQSATAAAANDNNARLRTRPITLKLDRIHKTQRRWKNARRCIRSGPLRKRAISR
ncbi:hypothetical protein ACDH50_19450, partial [Xanthomonas fragariae]